MSRFFVRASSQRLVKDGTPPVTAAPLTVACWFRKNNNTDGASLVALADQSANTDRFLLEARGSGPGRTIRWLSINGGTDSAETSTAWTVDTWHHACGVEAASNDRRVYLDGGGKVTDSGAGTPTPIDRLVVGADFTGSFVNHMGGDIAHVAMWNVALTDAEIASLAAGLNPKKMRPDNLVFYAPLNGQSPEIDIVSRFDLTVTGATVSEEPPAVRGAMVAPG